VIFEAIRRRDITFHGFCLKNAITGSEILRMDLHTEITIVKNDGRRFLVEDAIVEERSISFNDQTIPVERGDVARRQLPCAVDDYEILEVHKPLSSCPGWHHLIVQRKY